MQDRWRKVAGERRGIAGEWRKILPEPEVMPGELLAGAGEPGKMPGEPRASLFAAQNTCNAIRIDQEG